MTKKEFLEQYMISAAANPGHANIATVLQTAVAVWELIEVEIRDELGDHYA